MKLAADFRQAAREALRGKWPIAILIGLVAVLLGGAGSGGPEVKFNYDVSSGVSTTFGYGGQTIYSTGYGLDSKWSGLLVGGAVYLIVIALVLAAAYFILGSIVGVGMPNITSALSTARSRALRRCSPIFRTGRRRR